MSLSQDASRLSAGLTGEVVLPEQPGFDDARQAFNLAADQEPAAVVFAGSAYDVAAAITFAADHGRPSAAFQFRRYFRTGRGDSRWASRRSPARGGARSPQPGDGRSPCRTAACA
jgi:hypothetical protein